MNNITTESFINFCDEMAIIQEGFNLTSIKTFLKNMILRVLHKAESFFNKIRNEKIKNFLIGCVKKLRGLLGNVDKITPDNSSEKFSDISEECNKINDEIDTKVGKDDPEIDNRDERELKDTEDIKIIKRSRVGVSTYYYQVKLSNDYADKVYDVALKMDNAKVFSEYIGYFKTFKRMIQLPDKCTVYGLMIDIYGNLNCYYIVENKRPMKIGIDKALYHTSDDPNLTQITPKWRSEIDDGSKIPLTGRFFDTPRSFFGVYPMNRLGGRVKPGDSRTIYKAEGITKAFIDIDGIKYGTSVYVESTSPIRLTKVNSLGQ